MKIVLLTVGKTTAKNIVSGIEMYTERIRHYVPFELVSIPDLKSTAALSADQQKVREGQGIITALNPGDRVVLLDERGEMLTSRKFAQRFQQRMSAGVKRLVLLSAVLMDFLKKCMQGQMPGCRCRQ